MRSVKSKRGPRRDDRAGSGREVRELCQHVGCDGQSHTHSQPTAAVVAPPQRREHQPVDGYGKGPGDPEAIVDSLSRSLAHTFGVRPGDRVAIAMRNYPEWVLAFWAAARLGAVLVPLNAWWTGPELAYGLSDSGAKLLVADGDTELEGFGAASTSDG